SCPTARSARCSSSPASSAPCSPCSSASSRCRRAGAIDAAARKEIAVTGARRAILAGTMTTTARLAPAPASLADAAGDVPFGRYAGPIADTGTARWDGGLPPRRRTQRKAWLYLGAMTDRYMVGYAVVDAGLLGTGFAYAYDRERGLLVEEKVTVPIAFA